MTDNDRGGPVSGGDHNQGEGREICPDCHHEHTPTGCVGEPSPSDLWAGVDVAGCDCGDCGHPNHYSPDHDCAPFRGEVSS